jgi:hypothetical protein
VVAIKPNVKEALEMAGSAQDFRPRSALVITMDAAEADAAKPYVKEPFRVLAQPVAGGTANFIFRKKKFVACRDQGRTLSAKTYIHTSEIKNYRNTCHSRNVISVSYLQTV